MELLTCGTSWEEVRLLRHILERDIGPPIPSSSSLSLPGYLKVSNLLFHTLPAITCCFTTRPKAMGSTDLGLKPLKPRAKTFPLFKSITWLFCHSNGKWTKCSFLFLKLSSLDSLIILSSQCIVHELSSINITWVLIKNAESQARIITY